jgi:hypothetical protein
MPDIDLDGYEQIDWSQASVFSQDARGVGWRVMARMMYPDDTEKHNQILASLYARQLPLFRIESMPVHTSSDGQQFDPIRWFIERYLEPFGGHRAIADAPGSSELAQQIESATVAWLQVGILLRIVHTIDRNHSDARGGASINKAVEIFPAFMGSGAGIPVNPTDIRAAWASYKRVAHLCAAFVTTQCAGDYDIGGETLQRPPRFPIELAEFLAVARAYQEFGLTFKPRSRQDAILPSDLWSVPDSVKLRPATLAPAGLPPAALAALHAYKAPIRLLPNV